MATTSQIALRIREVISVTGLLLVFGCHPHSGEKSYPEYDTEAARQLTDRAIEQLFNGQISRAEACSLAREAAEERGPAATLWFWRINEIDFCGFSKDELRSLRPASSAFSSMQKRAEGGDVEAMALVGYACLNGIGIGKDVESGIRWLQEAADEGNSYALHDLGVQFEFGFSIKKDAERAFECYSLASAQGHQDSSINLARMLANGNGAPKDANRAIELLKPSASDGSSYSQNLLGSTYLIKGDSQDYEEARRWLLLASEKGHLVAQFTLGQIYRNGWGVEKNLETAHEWYLESATHELPNGEIPGHLAAIEMVAFNLFTGAGAAKDPQSGVTWAKKAAEKNSVWAKTTLGDKYFAGEGVPQSIVEAESWYRKAAEQGSVEGIKGLGKVYIVESSGLFDYSMAYVFYNLASARGDDSATEIRNLIAEDLSPKQLLDAQALTMEYQRLLETGQPLPEQNGE